MRAPTGGGARRGPSAAARWAMCLALWAALGLYAATIYCLSSAPLDQQGAAVGSLDEAVGEGVTMAGADHEERDLYAPMVEHVLLYAGLGALAFMAITSVRGLPIGSERARALAVVLAIWAAPLVAAIALGYGTFDEWHQSRVPGRTADALDVMMDILGALLGAAVAPDLPGRNGPVARWARLWRRARGRGHGPPAAIIMATTDNFK